jgi:D-sedoheptulose 7-phosphate isomerase
MTTDPRQLAERRIRTSLATQERLLETEQLDAILEAAEVIATSLRDGGRLLAFGNGGSAADATHIAAELVGRFLRDRTALPALSLSDNASAVTAIANDFGFDRVFARQVEAFGRAGDVALAISTSGASPNVLAALETARSRGMRTVGLTGGDGGALRGAVDVCIVIPADQTPEIQEGHTLVAHVLCELVEASVG